MPTEIKIEVKKLCADAKLPAKATSDSACYDVYAVERTTVYAHGSAIIKTGLAFKLPEGYEMQIRPRSGLAFNSNVVAFWGTLDSDYTGELKVKLFNLGNEPVAITPNTAVAQIAIAPTHKAKFITVQDLPHSTHKGFGSTDKK